MTPARTEVPGGTRTCPHCRQTILASAAICPVCRHHLRAGGAPTAGVPPSRPGVALLRVEGAVHHPGAPVHCEYSIIVSVYGEDGSELTRQVVGVGALKPNEWRTFNVAVEARETGTSGVIADRT